MFQRKTVSWKSMKVIKDTHRCRSPEKSKDEVKKSQSKTSEKSCTMIVLQRKRIKKAL